MPTNFLDLPREIRDQIYCIILPSSPTLIHAEELSTEPARFKLYRIALSSSQITARPPKRKYEDAATSLSILRTNRQVHNETRMLFWENATFFFPRYSPTYGLIPIKAMGQVASRLITKVCIYMTPRGYVAERSYKGLSKVLQTLASRARHGCLREVELVWSYFGLAALKDLSVNDEVAYERLLAVLRGASEGCQYKRTIWLPPPPSCKSRPERNDYIPRDLHLAFGGKLFVGDNLRWENFNEIQQPKP